MEKVDPKPMLNRKSQSEAREVLWDHFINHAPADPKNGLAPVILAAKGGSIYPVKTEVEDPVAMSRGIKELAKWWGADLIGITELESIQLQPQEATDTGTAEKNEDGGGSANVESSYRFAIVCAIASDHNPSEAKGLGGQVVSQNGAIVIHYLRSYIRELGYQAEIGGVDSLEVAAKAGLGRLNSSGRFVTTLKGAHVEVFEPVLTNMPLAVDPLPK